VTPVPRGEKTMPGIVVREALSDTSPTTSSRRTATAVCADHRYRWTTGTGPEPHDVISNAPTPKGSDMFVVRTRQTLATRTAIVALFASAVTTAMAFAVATKAASAGHRYEGTVETVVQLAIPMSIVVAGFVLTWARRNPEIAPVSDAHIRTVLHWQYFALFVTIPAPDPTRMTLAAIVFGVLWIVVDRVSKAIRARRS
jgi:hypothetical protein